MAVSLKVPLAESRRGKNRCRLAERLGPETGGVYYGWWIVVFGAVTAFFTGPGQTYSLGFFADEYTVDFGWSRSQTSGMYALATLASGMSMSLVGSFLDVLGSKRGAWITAAAFSISCYANSFVYGPSTVLLGFFLVRLLGQGERLVEEGREASGAPACYIKPWRAARDQVATRNCCVATCRTLHRSPYQLRNRQTVLATRRTVPGRSHHHPKVV